ncbi:uncharacterized protein [Apostichopus japonicus]|uniref:uncharacterized protein n=1 Tax=Stichopus japonicus TaxID=307972 RepID=UPI003AB51C85
MIPHESELTQTPSFEKRRVLPVFLVALMWSLGLIEWSQPEIFRTREKVEKPYPFCTTVTGKWTRRILSVTSRLYLVTLSSVYFYCGYTYVVRFFGKNHNFYHFASFLITYWPLMISVQLISLMTSVCRWSHNNDYNQIDGQWWTVFSESSIVRRFHSFEMSRFIPPNCKALFLFSFCGLVNMSMVNVHFHLANVNSEKTRSAPHFYVEHIVSLLSTWYFSTFCYFLYLQRLAIEFRFENLIWFVKKHSNCLVTCQIKLNDCFKDYLSVRRLVRPWITLVISATTFGLAVHVAWNYKAIGHEDASGYSTVLPLAKNISMVTISPERKDDFYFLDTLIFTNKGSVLFLSLLAVGGTDINHIWKRCAFTLNIIRSSKYEKCWKGMSKLIRHLNTDTAGGTILDILLPVLLLALGILGLQNFDF